MKDYEETKDAKAYLEDADLDDNLYQTNNQQQ